MDITERTRVVLGAEGIKKLEQSKVCVVGIGGVGSYALEMLARTHVGNIVAIDKDVVQESNINRQIIAYKSTLGMNKVDVARDRVSDISKKINFVGIKECINSDNVSKYITKDVDYVIDAIDMVDSKISIIQECKKLSIPVISCMGMAMRTDPLKITISDISKTRDVSVGKSNEEKIKRFKYIQC